MFYSPNDNTQGGGCAFVFWIPKECTDLMYGHIWPYLAYLGTYLGAQNMVKWGIPEKILQNAVQTSWS